MSFMRDSRKRKAFIALLSVCLALAVIIAACSIYLGSYYKADEIAISAFLPDGCEWKVESNGNIVIENENATRGFIFYPGGKVEHTAYIPLMQACAEEGVLCIIVDMPFRLAVLDMNAADGIREIYPQIKEWYIGGHSLGGAMAASYVEKHTDDYEGLILLGAYSTADLSDTDLKVLSLYGSEDGVMDRAKYEECRPNLPSGAVEIVIDGGCHAYFGMYGEQKGDGVSRIEPEDQIRQSADAIIDIMAS